MKTQPSQRAKADYSIDIDAPAGEVFPLACPVEELKWIDRWDFTMVYSTSGKNEPGCIFFEEMSAQHLAGPRFGGKTYWITTLYDPASQIIHFLLARTATLTQLTVTMDGLGAGMTRVNWNMTMTSISEEANEIFDETVTDRMTSMLMFLGQSLKHYCETGKKLVIPA